MLNPEQTVVKLSSVDSTNNYAANADDGGLISDNTVILAEEQTHGRGQRGKTWQASPNENLLLSWVRKSVNIFANEQFYISKAISLGIVDFLRKAGITASIKWPNDIVVNRKKMAGILIENQLEGKRVKRSIIGIGINVNQVKNLPEHATSLAKLLEEKIDLNVAFEPLMPSLNQRWTELQLKHYDILDADYESANFLCGLQLPSSLNSTVVGTNERGQLLVKKDGQTLAYAHGEIDLTGVLD